MKSTTFDLLGVAIHPAALDIEAQLTLVRALRAVIAAAPLFSPMTPWGKPMRVSMTSAGRYGWLSDRSGYRYSRTHPEGTAWPDIPVEVLTLWHRFAGTARAPDCCLINYYSKGARMGLHQDRDETDFSQPVLSVSLGDDALFRVGGTARKDPTASYWLKSGDIAVMGGAARLAYHGIDRTRHGSSTLLPEGGRINLTLRVVD